MAELVTKSMLDDAMDRFALRLTIRLGTMMAAGIALLAGLSRFH